MESVGGLGEEKKKHRMIVMILNWHHGDSNDKYHVAKKLSVYFLQRNLKKIFNNV